MRTLLKLVIYAVLLAMFAVCVFFFVILFDDSPDCGPGTVERDSCVISE